MLHRQFQGIDDEGFFRTGPISQTQIDSPLPLALLQLAGALSGRDGVPSFYANNSYFDPKVVIARRDSGL